MSHPTKPSEPLSHDELDDFVNREVLTMAVFAGSIADLSRFKHPNGGFKRWLHVFHAQPHCVYRNASLKTLAVVPWCWDGDEIDFEFHEAAAALGAYVNYPLAWRSMAWKQRPLDHSPIYGLFTSNPGLHGMHQAIATATNIHPIDIRTGSHTEKIFWEKMTQFILLPTISGSMIPMFTSPTQPSEEDINASSRLGQAGSQALRERGHRSPHRPTGMRKIPSDRK